MSHPRISVIIPCFNHGEFLSEAVASVLSVKRDDLELIVVDDGSTDERTRAEMNKLQSSGIHVIRQENKGLSAARNAGIRASKAEYIFPLDADDRARPEFLSHAITTFQQDSKIGVVYGDAEFFGTRTGRWVMGPFDTNRLLYGNFIPASAVYRRAVWELSGGYDERMEHGFEDWEFWLNAYQHGWQFAYIREILFEYRKAQDSMLTRVLKHQDDAARFIAEKHSALYRQAFVQLSNQKESGKATFHNLRRIVADRLKHRLGLNGK